MFESSLVSLTDLSFPVKILLQERFFCSNSRQSICTVPHHLVAGLCSVCTVHGPRMIYSGSGYKFVKIQIRIWIRVLPMLLKHIWKLWRRKNLLYSVHIITQNEESTNYLTFYISYYRIECWPGCIQAARRQVDPVSRPPGWRQAQRSLAARLFRPKMGEKTT